MKAIRVYQTGGPDALRYEDTPDPRPGEGQALVKIEAIGVNFIDIYYRTGLYTTSLPFTPGNEAAGVVVAVGKQVHEVQVNDRVAFAGTLGTYAQLAALPAWRLIKIPADINFQTAAAAMLQGMTAHYLTSSTYPLRRGDTALVHAAAGGVGLLLIQMAKQRGARIFGTVSTIEKAKPAREAGADEIILYSEQDFEAEVRRLTNGHGVQVVYDSVGKATFEKSLRSLAPRGYLVLFGQSSGPVPPFDPQILSQGGSLFLTRPVLWHYTSTRYELEERANDLFESIRSSKLRIRIDRTFKLENAREAHSQLEGRRTIGKLLLIP